MPLAPARFTPACAATATWALVRATAPPPAAGQLPEAAAETWADIVAEWRGSVRDEGIVGSSLALIADGRAVDLQTEGILERLLGTLLFGLCLRPS